MSIPTGFLFTLLEDLFLPESQRLVTFPAEEARYGLLPGAREFTGVGRSRRWVCLGPVPARRRLGAPG